MMNLRFGATAALLALTVFTAAAGAQAPKKKRKSAKPAAAATPAPAVAEPATSAATGTPLETAATVTPTPDTVHAADTTNGQPPVADQPKKKKKGGLFGKMKDVAGSKVVQSVAKTAACTMVPGGQVIAGAIDAGSAGDAAGTATGAGGAVSGAACGGMMGGMGAGGMAPGGMGGVSGAAMAAQQQGMMQQQMSQQQAIMAQQQAMMAQMAATSGSPGAATALGGANAMGMGDENTAAACLGLSLEEYRMISNPTGGVMRPLTKDEMKRQAKAAKKIDSEAQQKMATANAGGGPTEAPDESIQLAADPVGELKKGKTAARNIDWVAGTGQVSPAGQAAFADAMAKLGSAMRAAGRQYRLDLYLDQRYDEVAVSTIGPQRLAVAQAALALGGIATDAVALGKTKRDKNPRLEVVRAK